MYIAYHNVISVLSDSTTEAIHILFFYYTCTKYSFHSHCIYTLYFDYEHIQVERQTGEMFDQMRGELEHVETNLSHTRVVVEKQSWDFTQQKQEEKKKEEKVCLHRVCMCAVCA